MKHHQFAATAAKRALRLSPLELLAAIFLTVPLSHSQLTYPPRYPLPSDNFLYQHGYVYGQCARSVHNRANYSADQLQIGQNEDLKRTPQQIDNTGNIVGDLVAVALLRNEIINDYIERFRELDLTLRAMLISCANAQITASTHYSGPSRVDYYILALASSLSPLRIRWLAYPQRRGD